MAAPKNATLGVGGYGHVKKIKSGNSSVAVKKAERDNASKKEAYIKERMVIYFSLLYRRKSPF
jgi:hypothetical protein